MRGVLASEALLDYLQALIAATRSGQWFVDGLSPRAGIAVLRVAKARALMAQRDYVAPDDIQAILPQTIAHRLQPMAGAGRGRVEQVRAMVEAAPCRERRRAMRQPGRAVMIAERVRGWFENRLPVSDTATLTQHNIYILPTKAGLAFALTLLVMLVASINYQLNLGYVLTFLLAGSGAGVDAPDARHAARPDAARCEPPRRCSPATAPRLEVVMSNPGAARHGVGLRFVSRARPRAIAWCDVPAQGQASARVSFVPPTRGLACGAHAGGRDALSVRPVPRLDRTGGRPARCWPIRSPKQPPRAAAGRRQAAPGARAGTRAAEGSELDGVRAWRRGDALRQVVWKKVARSGELVSRETSAESSRELWLDWQAAPAPASDVEARLSRLAAWVLAAEQQGWSYGLRLPGRSSRRTAATRTSARAAARRWRCGSELTHGAGPTPRCRAGPAGATCRATAATRCSSWR